MHGEISWLTGGFVIASMHGEISWLTGGFVIASMHGGLLVDSS